MKRKTREYPPIEPPWEYCPECGHHQMSHKHKEHMFACVVFECPCEWSNGAPDEE